jgi:LPXTG-site transpeptidase (sortase) family protein
MPSMRRAAVVIEARMSQDAARRSLELATRSRVFASPHDAIGTVNLGTPHPIVARGSPIAELLIPRVHLSSIVLHGSDAQTLRHGPGHLEHTPLPGEPGNVAIAGHRDTFFRQLRDLTVGDDIFLDTPQGDFHYRIDWARVVGAHDVSVLEPTTRDVLTLITCYPFWVLGPAPNRFVVRATRIGDTRAATEPAHPSTPVAVPARAAGIETPGIVAQARASAAVVHDDETLIRIAIERFRVAYNAWLINHNAGGAGLLQLSNCGVAITGDQAEATCRAWVGDATDSSDHLRTFSVERANGAWAIRSTTD